MRFQQAELSRRGGGGGQPRHHGERRTTGAHGHAAPGTLGHSTYPHGSDQEDPFAETVWWVDQELVHHGAEIALIRDLFRARQR